MLVNRSVRLNSNRLVRGNIREEQVYVLSSLARPSDNARKVGSPSMASRIIFNNLRYSVLLRIRFQNTVE
jgi:hypothetical protein